MRSPARSTIPLVHIADATAVAVARAACTTVGLLGTAYTMEQDFYVGRLRDMHGLEVLVPPRPTAAWCTTSSTRSSASAWSPTTRARSTGGSCRALAERGAEGDPPRLTEIDLLVGQRRAGAGLRHHPPARAARRRPRAQRLTVPWSGLARSRCGG